MGWFRSNKENSVERSPGDQLTLPIIRQDKIHSLTSLDGPHYVFKLLMKDRSKVVLKAEKLVTRGASADSHNLGVRIMGYVSPVRAQTLNDQELIEVNKIISNNPDFLLAKQKTASNDAHWVKAYYQSGLEGMKHTDANYDIIPGVGNSKDDYVLNENKKKKNANYMADLSLHLADNRKAWASLGEVVAVDMLLGNLDRMNLKSGEFSNLGNVLFIRKGNKMVNALPFRRGKGFRAIGLDTFDTGHMGSSDLIAGNHDEWKISCGTFLKNPDTAKPKFKDAITNVVLDMQSNYKIQSSWGYNEADYMHDGYVKAINFLKTKVKKEIDGGQGKNATELKNRLIWLGW